MTRITLVMAGDEEGGLEKHVMELTNGLAELGHQVSLVAHSKYADRVLPQVSFTAVDLSKSRRNPMVLWQLYQAIKQSNPDVIHVHANKAVAMVAPLLKWLQVPSVATLHNIKANLNAFKKFDRVITVSRRVASQFVDQQKIRIVLNGVHPSKQAIVDKTWQADHVQAISVGRLVPAKGFDLLIEAWKGINAKLWIVGSGPDQSQLEQQVQSSGLGDKISFLGHRDDIPQLISNSDFFVIASHNEGGPYTLSEALLLKRPVLSTDVGMVPEVLPAEYVVEPNNVAALHTLIAQNIQQPDKLKHAFEAVYQLANEQLTFEAMLRNTVAVYQEVIS
jgi:glycosyltransferase involved in cell wall biosynthesis